MTTIDANQTALTIENLCVKRCIPTPPLRHATREARVPDIEYLYDIKPRSYRMSIFGPSVDPLQGRPLVQLASMLVGPAGRMVSIERCRDRGQFSVGTS